MSHTFSIDHAPTTTESVNVEVAPKSELTLLPNDGSKNLSSYVLASGDNAYPATVTYRSELQNSAEGAARRITQTFSTWAVDANSVSGEDLRKKITVSTSIIVPADFTVEVADLDDLLGNAFSFWYASVSAGARNTGYLQKLLYGVTAVI